MEIQWNGYRFKYYFRPGQKLSAQENLKILKELQLFNQRSYKFEYGLFDPNRHESELIKLFDDYILCLIFLGDEIVGFSYFHILEQSDKQVFIQLGLIVIAKNHGYDLFSFCEKNSLLIVYKELGPFVGGIVTTIPKIYEEYVRIFSDTWPHPRSNLARAPAGYKHFAKLVGEKYIPNYFPKPFSVNYKRFTLKLDKRESGFHDRFHELPMAKNFIYNSFCSSWINYEEQEDLIVIGKYDFYAFLRTYIDVWRLKWNGMIQGKAFLLVKKLGIKLKI